MKKLRGKRRYYRNLLSKVPNFKLDLADDHWYDMWHMHVDWYGLGNESKKARYAHLTLYFCCFKISKDNLNCLIGNIKLGCSFMN